MGRKAFINDLRDAALPGRFFQISSVSSGDDDGAIRFIFHSAATSAEEIAVDAMVSDVSDYPSDHTYFLFTTSEHVPATVNEAIESIQPSVSGHSVSQMLLEVSAAISHALAGGGRPAVDAESGRYTDSIGEEDPLTEDDSDAEMWSTSSPAREMRNNAPAKDTFLRSTSNKVIQARIRTDLRLAKEAGFKTGILGDLPRGGIVCLSVRVAKLGISEEAMNAWGLERNQYLVLLIRYGSGYKSIEDVKEETASTASRTEFRVALCQQYKPSMTEAFNAFSPHSARSFKSQQEAGLPKDTVPKAAPGTLEPLFIGRPLNDLLTRLPAIIKYRLACSFSWTGAELFSHEIQAKAAYSIDPTQRAFYVADQPLSQALPKIVTADHIEGTFLSGMMSFPLAAMQFVLRHVVRCTEFCLVCHCKVDNNFEALKPYVCSKPLCLFQYMALGFGPSIEWEIRSQPYVVDLLVSFCYASAQGQRLRDFPIGIDLKVPLLPRPLQSIGNQSGMKVASVAGSAPSMPVNPPMPRPISCRVDSTARELLFAYENAPGPLKIGDWIAITAHQLGGISHAQVEENFFPTIRLGELIYVSKMGPKQNFSPALKIPSTVGFVEAEVFVYDQSFDDLPDYEKQNAIIHMLDTVPDIIQLKTLLDSDSQEASLKRLRHRLSDTALNLLRWIIASNRSCIMQVDRMSSSSSVAGAEDRVSGMSEWLQFRFAQGAPDKEQRFIDCVKEVATRLKLEQYPTLFAWHGSPLVNWHSIIREGLHFNQTVNGRAFGHGVYMSSQASTSIGYSGLRSHQSDYQASTNWPNSKLCVSSALALNEVVNAPDEFVHKNPHYVVSQLDWIQTRFLFIKGNHRELGHDFNNSTAPKNAYIQHPARTARDERNQAIIIPITAVSRSHRPVAVTSPVSRGTKKAKVVGSSTQEQVEKTEDDAASMGTSASDVEYLLSEVGEDEAMSEDTTRSQKESLVTENVEVPQTDFIPNQLSASSLHLLAPPTNASTGATKALLTTLKQTLHIQNTTPLHELGWYIPESLISNIYQWIIELHSFDHSLPLAADMRAAGLKSIILEMRFSSNFPMSPPFVRVIRPRFLPFMHGGGGHVTAGGALCMELLTNSGWSPVSSVESVLLQVRVAMSNREPKPARLMMARRAGGQGRGKNAEGLPGSSGSAGYGHTGAYSGAAGGGEYTVGEAVEAYKRACALHGWQVPKEFDEFLMG